jgi:hypothetical protein
VPINDERTVHRAMQRMDLDALWRNKALVAYSCLIVLAAFLFWIVFPGGTFLLPWQRSDVNAPSTTVRTIGTVVSITISPGKFDPIFMAKISYGRYVADVTAPPSASVGDRVEVSYSREHPAVIYKIRLVERQLEDQVRR